MISLTNEVPNWYIAGFSHPMGGNPRAMRAALRVLNTPATTGQDAEVPATPASSGMPVVFDGTMMWNQVPAADMSGTPLPPVG